MHRHTSPHPLVSPGEPQTSARECSLWQTSLDACSVANTAALFLSPGTSSDEGKNRSNPFLFQITCTALDVTEKTFQAPEMSLAEQGNFQCKNPHNKVQTKWKDLQLRRRTELYMALIVKHSTQSVISSLLMVFVTKTSLLDFFFFFLEDDKQLHQEREHKTDSWYLLDKSVSSSHHPSPFKT